MVWYLLFAFFDIIVGNLVTLLMAVYPLFERAGEVGFVKTAGDPVPGRLKAAVRQGAAGELVFEDPKQPEVCRSQVRAVRWVLEHLLAPGGQIIADGSGSVNRSVVPVKNDAGVGLLGALFVQPLIKIFRASMMYGALTVEPFRTIFK